MMIEFNLDGSVLNILSDEAVIGVWYPDDTVIQTMAHGPAFIGPPERQSPDFPARAGRAWDPRTRTWELTGADPVVPEKDQARKDFEAVDPATVTTEELARLLIKGRVFAQVEEVKRRG